MKNYIQEGDVLDVVLAADVASGGVVLFGDLVGIAQTDGKNGETIAVSICGVYEVAKASGSYSQGVKLYWDATNSVVTTTSSGNKLAGYAAAASSGSTIALKLIC